MKKKIFTMLISALLTISITVSAFADIGINIVYGEDATYASNRSEKATLSEEEKIKIKAVVKEAVAAEHTWIYNIYDKIGITENKYDLLWEYLADSIVYDADLYCVEGMGVSDNWLSISYKNKYIKEDGSINKVKAKNDWNKIQKQLQTGQWKQTVNDRIEACVPDYVSDHYHYFAVVNVRDICKNVTTEEVKKYLKNVILYNPEYYFLEFYFLELKKGTFIVEIKSQYNNKNNNTIDRLQAVKDAYEKADRLSSINISDEMTDIEKVLAAHEWVVRECEYDYKNFLNNSIPNISYTKEGVIEEGIAVCSGYAKAMQYILDGIGIESYYVPAAKMNHAWNIVKIGNSYYHLDATWDDRGHDDNDEGVFYHTYFLKSDAEMENLSHYGWDADVSCTDSGNFTNYIFGGKNAKYTTAYNYFDGFWYYMSGDSWYNVYKSKIDGTQKTVFMSLEERIINTYIYKGSMYLATKTKVYKINMKNTSKIEVIFDIENDNSMAAGIDEFVIKQDAIKIDSGQNSRYISLKLNTSSIKLNKTNVDMLERESMKLQTTYFSPYSSKVKWSSTNPLAVAVDDAGNVTACGAGTAVIVASVDGITTECTVTSKALYTYGDINDDGTIDTQDAVLIKKYLAGYKGLDINLDACDVNADGEVTSADAVLLLKKLAGYNVTLGEK